MDKYYLAALSHFTGYINTELVSFLKDQYGSAQKVMAAETEILTEFPLAKEVQSRYKDTFNSELPHRIRKYCEEEGVKVIALGEAEYPQGLLELYNPPSVIYLKGNPLRKEKHIAVVGPRWASSYGLKVTGTFTRAFAEADIPVISGCTYGVCCACHQGMLRSKSSSVAVLGSGFEQMYPKGNIFLFKELCEKGTLLTEFIPWEKPRNRYLAYGNRIIAGLAHSMLVVEGYTLSGSMHAARLALEGNRDIYAVPGNIFSNMSRGTNALIEDGAISALSPESVIEKFMG